MVRLYTLGRVQLVRGEPERREPVPVQEKRLALLAYLATAGPEPWVRRDTLLAAFWPELSGDDARRALRQALHYLRNLLGDGVIVARGDELAIAPERLWCDAAQLASGGETRETLELYRGDFLAGFFAADAGPAFDDWLAASRRRFRERAVAVAWAVADAETAAGSPLAAAAAARRAVDLAPLDEPGVRRLMALLARLGDRAGALAAYADLAGRLRAEFDAAPASETEAAARQIRAQGDEAPPLEARRTPGPAAPSAAPPPGSAPGRPDRRRMAALVGGLVLVAAAILAGLILRPGSPDPASLIARGTLREQDLILVADFRDQTRDSLLAPAVTELVRVGLAEASVRVMNRRRIADARRRMGLDGEAVPDSIAREIAAREGAKAVIAGTVTALGPGLSISAEIVSAESGETLVTVSESASDSTGLIRAVDRLAVRLRRSLGDPLRRLRDRTPLEQVTTSSLAALRAYTAAERLKQTGQDRDRELRLLEQATAADTGFATAWHGLANLYSVTGQAHLARQAITRAFNLRHRLPERERLSVEASYHSYVTGDERETAAAYLALLERDSTDFRILHNLGLTYQALRDYEAQERLARRALRWSDSSYSVVWLGLLQALVNRGALAQAETTLAAARARFPDDPYLLWVEGYIAQNVPDLAAVDRIARQLIDTPGHQLEGNRLLADLHQLQGRLRLAEHYRREGIRVAEGEGRTAHVVQELGAIARGRQVYQSEEAARRFFRDEVVRRGLDRLPLDDRPFDALVAEAALLGLPDLARAQLAAARGEGAPAAPVLRRMVDAAEARERGDLDGLAARLGDAFAADQCPVCLLPLLGDALVEAGRSDSARVIYRRYLETPYIHRLESDARYLVPVLVALARLEMAAGADETAAALARRAAGLLRSGDPETAALLTEAQRLQRRGSSR